MITVTIKPYNANNDALTRIQTRYPDAFLNVAKRREAGRFACDLPSKDESNWTQDDANFFNDLCDKDEVLISWAILGGMPGH
jgi:hypothetical protein